jgi:hypothetical protein
MLSFKELSALGTNLWAMALNRFVALLRLDVF